MTIGLSLNDKFEEWRNNIVIFAERKINIEAALDFAERYSARALLCRLVYDGGHKYYNVLYRCIDEKWGSNFLELALMIIYDQDELRVRLSV